MMEPRAETRVFGGFEGSNIHNIARIGTAHFSCEMKPETPSRYEYPDHHGYWFHLGIENPPPAEVTIDITNCDWMPSHWKHYKPVVTYTHPDLEGPDGWERVENTSRSGRTFRFTHRYRGGTAWVALRYPYTNSRHRRFLDTLEGLPFARIENILRTREGRSLDVVTVTDPSLPVSGKRKILVYAREHASEQEGSWVCQGMIDFLVSGSPEARALREKAVFLIVPIVAPDAAYHGRCTDPHTGGIVACDFWRENAGEMRMAEAAALWRKVRDFSSDGDPLDICISLHSPHGWEENIWSHLHDRIKRKEGKRLNKAIFARCGEYSRRGPEFAWGRFSLPGRCAREFGSIALLLEINQHAKRRFLHVRDLHRIGENICKGISDHYGF